MIRICHIISGGLWAGAEVVAFNILRGLKKYQDVEISVILFNEGTLATKIRELNVTLEIVDESKMSLVQIISSLKKIFQKIPPGVVHTHGYKESILAYIARTKKSIKLVETRHGMPEKYGKNRNLKYLFLTKLNFILLSRYFHNVIAVSKDIKKVLISQYGFPKDKVVVIHNGINIPEDILLDNDNNSFVVGSAGRFSPVKDYLLMVRIGREILKESHEIRLKLIGDGPEKAKIQKFIRIYGLDKTFLLEGFLEDTSSFYRGIDIYLNTSLHEGISMSVLEAMSYGLPVIAPKVGGFTEIIDDGEQGFLIEGRYPEKFAEKCMALYKDKALRKKMSLAAREKVTKEFSIDQMAHKYYQLYRDALRNCDNYN
jgi:L-malate glycosyltransferase